MTERQKRRSRAFDLEFLETRRLLTTASIGASNTLIVLGTSSAETISLTTASGGKVAVSGVVTTFTPGSSAGQFNKISIDAGGGNDTISIATGVVYTNSTIAGGAGNDTITGGSYADSIGGGDGNDRLNASGGPDIMAGNVGFDTANYSARTAALKIDLDDVADDGQISAGEGDNVTTTTEEVLGGSGNDSINGSGLDDFLSGGGGNDTLTGHSSNDELIGSTGSDAMYGNDGDDFLMAQNSDVDTVSGGTNSDASPDLDMASIDVGVDVASSVSAALVQLLLADSFIAADTGSPSNLDTSYNDDGLTTPGPEVVEINAAAATADGGLVLVGSVLFEGNQDFVVIRLDSNGELDGGFGAGGMVAIDFGSREFGSSDIARGVTIDPSGRIVVVGEATSVLSTSSDVAVVRLSSDGTLDTDFSGDGLLLVDASSEEFGVSGGDVARDVAIGPNDEIIIVGDTTDTVGLGGSDLMVVQLTDAGALDANFGGNGIATLDVGQSVDGQFFSSDDHANGVALQTLHGEADPHTAIIVAGSRDSDMVFVRFLDTGAQDGDFASGFLTVDLGGNEAALDVAVGSGTEQDIVAVGTSSAGIILSVGSSAVVVQLDEDGALTASAQYSDPNTLSAYYSGVAIDADDNFVVSGGNGQDFLIGRYLRDSLAFDTDFAAGPVTTDFSSDLAAPTTDGSVDVFVLETGQILAAGWVNDKGITGPAAARYTGSFEEPDPYGIEEYIDYDDIHGFPPNPRITERFETLSGDAIFYILAQSDGDGNAVIDLDERNDRVVISQVTNENGDEELSILWNGLVLFYDPETMAGITINGNGGNDTVTVGRDVTVPIIFNGSEGADSFSGGSGNDQFLGGPGNDVGAGNEGADVLVGGGGNDSLSGETGNDILIGSEGQDRLTGSNGEDILIGGTTSYDDDNAALEDLSAEWRSATLNASRISNLRLGGGLNGTSIFAVGTTVFDDGVEDKLTGSNDRDWFFAKLTGAGKDKITDNTAGEELDLM
jgi:uncharacterized delta-60 repeat protein